MRAGTGIRISLAVVCVAGALSACGGGTTKKSSGQRGQRIDLTVVSDDSKSPATLHEVHCRDGKPMPGALDVMGQYCERASDLASFLLAKPDAARACTQVYGGPQTAKITGKINGKKVDRSFARTNGCEIAEWNKIEKLLSQGPPN